MKAIRFFPHHLPLAALAACLLSAPSLQAQTFSGAKTITDSPAHLEATVYPLTNTPSTIKVIFNNPAGGMVRVVIRDQKNKVFYDEYESIALYRRKFDLSSLPEGNYTVELSKQNERFSQVFAITPSVTESRIAMSSPTLQPMPGKSGPAKLIVSQ